MHFLAQKRSTRNRYHNLYYTVSEISSLSFISFLFIRAYLLFSMFVVDLFNRYHFLSHLDDARAFNLSALLSIFLPAWTNIYYLVS